MEILEFHEVCYLFPEMDGPQFQGLMEDIATHGQHTPIYTWQGQIIDGRSRYRACLALDIAPKLQEWDGEGDLVAFTVSLNLHRRHLTESQRAMVAGKAARMQQGGDRRSEDFKAQVCALNQAQAAALVGVSERSVTDARKVLTHGTDELQKAVERGDVAVSTAAAVASLPKKEQEAIVTGGASKIKAAAKQVQQAKRQEAAPERPTPQPAPKPKEPAPARQPEPVAPKPAPVAPSTVVVELQRLWQTASNTERAQFHDWIHSIRGI